MYRILKVTIKIINTYHWKFQTLYLLFQDIFVTLSTVDDSLYFMCNVEDFKFLADMIQHVPLPLRARYVFCCAPINRKMPFVCSMFLKVLLDEWAKQVKSSNVGITMFVFVGLWYRPNALTGLDETLHIGSWAQHLSRLWAKSLEPFQSDSHLKYLYTLKKDGMFWQLITLNKIW